MLDFTVEFFNELIDRVHCYKNDFRVLPFASLNTPRAQLKPSNLIQTYHGAGINAVISAIAGVIMAIVGAITTVIVTIFDVILDILCCRCFGSRRAGMRTGRRRGGAVGATTY
ncbi:hypothetical protein EV361DRAFT_866138 [Lentinula raphanica]|uniref:Uncharacterized protein n=1 Tax=Lentinula raphanica TaxID=153919 RepID=A0AA38UJ36_9AGAR|nr:hypothetical protein F5880DRAFT_1501799 [Lentinula raphanica]KAJ3840287.1 hypothetical protein F5878DRAFT_640531 [Lentinula raphanica]KAJ3974460.1 hypothetical protein EV361DRAFT_866138 [Lentinula raphanica]